MIMSRKKVVLAKLRGQIHDGERLRRAGKAFVAASQKSITEARQAKVAYEQFRRERQEAKLASLERKLVGKKATYLRRKRLLELKNAERQLKTKLKRYERGTLRWKLAQRLKKELGVRKRKVKQKRYVRKRPRRRVTKRRRRRRTTSMW